MIRRIYKHAHLDPTLSNNLNTPQQVRERINYFKQLSLNGLETLTTQEIQTFKIDISEFLSYGIQFVNNWHDKSSFYRATVNKRIPGYDNLTPLARVTNLTAPPKAALRMGRCNLTTQPIFYASTHPESAILEAVPGTGDLVTLSKWTLKDNVKLPTHLVFHPDVTDLMPGYNQLFSEFTNHQKGISNELGQITDDVLRFITEEFTKDVDSKHPINYLISAHAANNLFTYSKPHPTLGWIMAILYPSVKINGPFNLAIVDSLVHQKFDLESVAMYEVTETQPNFRSRLLNVTNNVNMTTDSITW